MTGSLSETPFSARVLTSSLAKLNSPRARDCVVSRFISSYSNGMRSSKERYIIDRDSHRSQRWCNLSNSVRKCVPYTTTSITLRGASGVRMRSAGPSLKRGPATARGPAHLRGWEIVTRLDDETSGENVIRAMEVHTPAFIYLCSVKKPSGRGEIESGCIWQAAECMTDTSCGISGRTKSLMLRLNRHRPLNDYQKPSVPWKSPKHRWFTKYYRPGQIYSQRGRSWSLCLLAFYF